MKTGPFSKLKTGPVLRFNAHGRFSLGGSDGSSHLRFSMRTGFGFQLARENHATLQKTPPK
jgi:hypothetical protein